MDVYERIIQQHPEFQKYVDSTKAPSLDAALLSVIFFNLSEGREWTEVELYFIKPLGRIAILGKSSEEDNSISVVIPVLKNEHFTPKLMNKYLHETLKDQRFLQLSTSVVLAFCDNSFNIIYYNLFEEPPALIGESAFNQVS